MSIISPSYFIDQLALPVDNISIQQWINKEEPIILRKILGYSLYKDFVAGIAVLPTPLTKWTNLQDGVEYTDTSGNLQKYDGIFLIITDHVYYAIQESIQKEATDSGVKIPIVDNAENGSPREKMLYANNDMVNRIAVMNDFINKTNSDTPDTYENYLPEIIEKVNTFDL